jgi:iron(III) transport system substrate-binding protein
VVRLLAGARDNREQELNVSWGAGGTLGDPEDHRLLADLFERIYGVPVKVNFIPAPGREVMVRKIGQEAAAGQKASSDILLGTERHFAQLLGHDVLEEYDYTALSPRITAEVVAHRNSGVEIYSTIPGIIYNTDLVSEAERPQRMEDVLHPKWRGRLVSPSAAAYFDAVAMRPEWGRERMKAFMARLSQNVGGLVLQASDTSRLLTGEFAMLTLGPIWAAYQQKAKGAPISFVIPEDGAIARFVQMGVPRNSAHPNLAKLYINTILSEEAQRLLFSRYGYDHHGLPGSQSGAVLADLQARGVRLLEIDSRFILDYPEIDGLDQELAAILREHQGR